MPPETSVAPESSGRPAEASRLPAAERALLAAVLQKDRKAAAEFVSRYADAVYGYVSRRLAPRRDLVEDIVQDVFLAALQKLDTFAGHSSIVGWLLGIARHKVEDFYRALLRQPEPLFDDPDSSDMHPVVESQLDELIDAARAQDKTRRILERLPPAYSAALLWRYWEKRSIKEMAAQTGKTEKAMERLLARARTHFKRLWEVD
jgi:RNA polymerase sigma-70 factor, ECF subfamily